MQVSLNVVILSQEVLDKFPLCRLLYQVMVLEGRGTVLPLGRPHYTMGRQLAYEKGK